MLWWEYLLIVIGILILIGGIAAILYTLKKKGIINKDTKAISFVAKLIGILPAKKELKQIQYVVKSAIEYADQLINDNTIPAVDKFTAALSKALALTKELDIEITDEKTQLIVGLIESYINQDKS